MREISIKIDKDNDINKPHNGKHITMIEVSPKGKYLVTYSEDNKTIACWNVEDVSEGQLKSDYQHIIDEHVEIVRKICVSDDKILAYIWGFNNYVNIINKLKIIDMNNHKEIELNLDIFSNSYYHCSFNLKDIIQSYNFMNLPDLYPLVLNLSFPNELTQDTLLNNRIWNFIMKYCWKNSQLPKELQTENLPILSLLTNKHIFGILDGYIWKIKLEERSSKMSFLYENSDELSNEPDKIINSLNSDELNNVNGIITEDSEISDADKIIERINVYLNSNGCNDNKEMYEDLNTHLFNAYTDTIRKWLKSKPNNQMENLTVKWKVNGVKLKLLVLKKISFNEQNYDWLLEIIMPQPSPFVKTISSDIYKTWNGEAIINFKWNTFGKYYYLIIWVTFMALLGCFTTAVTIPQQYIDKDVQVQLLIASIILGLIHLSFEIRQIIYNPIKWISNFWNIFKTNFSFDNRVINNDPNNPWNIVPTYGKVLDDGTIDSNPYIIQLPNENTNMFIKYQSALFAMYKFLTGDSSSLSNWSYMNNPSIVILSVLFSLLIVVYLMNLFIGLLNIAIDKDNDRVSYLIQKAEILAEIELFYLLPHQRRWKEWFPEVIYYYANVDKTREEIKKLISDGQWDADVFSEMREDLLKKLNIQNYKTDQKLLKEIQEKQEADRKLLKEIQEKNETDQKLLKEIQEKHENDQKLLKEIREILLTKQ
ncbi:hypothetical protein C1646_805680 [Rhizophagus diaphanus]|nr:hypothetical protein C1646_805680 [Rhizophagus diaphanus] [Rhizophagus sp. MUCL 43196]